MNNEHDRFADLLDYIFREVLNNTNHGKNKFYEDGSLRWNVMNTVNMSLFFCLFILSLLPSLRKR